MCIGAVTVIQWLCLYPSATHTRHFTSSQTALLNSTDPHKSPITCILILHQLADFTWHCLPEHPVSIGTIVFCNESTGSDLVVWAQVGKLFLEFWDNFFLPHEPCLYWFQWCIMNPSALIPDSVERISRCKVLVHPCANTPLSPPRMRSATRSLKLLISYNWRHDSNEFGFIHTSIHQITRICDITNQEVNTYALIN